MDIRPTLAVIVPGIGAPRFAHKVEILRSNMASFTGSDFWREVRFYGCVYDDSRIPQDILSRPDFVEFRRRGQLCENMHALFRPATFDGFDDVAILLDDVEIDAASADWPRAMRIKRAAGLDVLSPCMQEAGMTPWDYMNHDPNLRPNCVTYLAKCELFCYVMTNRAYRTYFDFIDPSNPGMWGLDQVLSSHMRLSAGLLNGLTMRHYYKDWNPKSTAKKASDAANFLERLGTSWDAALAEPAVQYRQCFM